MIRLLDILISGIALAILSPMLVLIALILRFSGEHEVFYRQSRVGKDGKMFQLLKFATMLKNSPNIGAGLLTVKNDPRVLPAGRFLRKTKLNELPQLFNVFVGDMSLIGPRPQAKPHFDVFPDAFKQKLVSVRPGLSGIGSVVFRDEESILERAADKQWFYAHVIAPYKGAVECWYIDRYSIWLYLALIVLTVLAIVFPSSRVHRIFFRQLPTPPVGLAGI